MNLRNEIMNLPCINSEALADRFDMPTAYKCGHRDARHAAAELANKADERIEELEKALETALNVIKLIGA